MVIHQQRASCTCIHLSCIHFRPIEGASPLAITIDAYVTSIYADEHPMKDVFQSRLYTVLSMLQYRKLAVQPVRGEYIIASSVPFSILTRISAVIRNCKAGPVLCELRRSGLLPSDSVAVWCEAVEGRARIARTLTLASTRQTFRVTEHRADFFISDVFHMRVLPNRIQYGKNPSQRFSKNPHWPKLQHPASR